MRYSLKEITSFLSENHNLVGKINDDVGVTNAKPISEADEESLSWISPMAKNKNDLARSTKAGVTICDKSIELYPEAIQQHAFIIFDNPR